MKKVLFFLVVLVAIYFLYSYFSTGENEYVTDLIQLSNGTMDEPALSALKELESPMTNKDSFNKAQLINLNLYEGRINNPVVLREVADLYQINTENDDNELDWFEIQQIENFTMRNNLRNNPVYDDFVRTTENMLPKKIKETIEFAKENSESKTETLDNYITANVKFTSDPQNVHDSAVNKQIRNSYRLLVDNTNIIPDIKVTSAEIMDYIDSMPDLIKKKRARKALETILGPGIGNSPFNENLNVTESDLLNLVWQRSNVLENEENKDNIQEAVITGLTEMADTGTVVCSGGRISRMIGSLTLLDAKKEISEPLFTVETIRNEMLQTSREILNDTVSEFKTNKDIDLKNVADSYDSVEPIETNPEKEKIFKDIVVSKINDTLEQKYKDKLPLKDFDNIKSHCVEAVESI